MSELPEELGSVSGALLDGAGALTSLARALNDGLLTMPNAQQSVAGVVRDAFIVTLAALDRALLIVGRSTDDVWCRCPTCDRLHVAQTEVHGQTTPPDVAATAE